MAGPKVAGKTDKHSSSLSFAAKTYLVAFNVVSFIGWSYVLFLAIQQFVTKSEESLWDAVGPALMFSQSLAALEVLHVAIGIVRSGFITTVVQVASRLSVVWLNLYLIPESRLAFGFPQLLVAWCITEIIRYSYYALGIVNKIPYFLTWARYSFFFVLYPIGASGEVIVTWHCLPYAAKSSLNLVLPNVMNFTFSHLRYLQTCIVAYIFLLPLLYFHMISQRKKVLGAAISKSKTK